MDTVTAFVATDPTTCFRAFTDARHLAAWVPGLRRADILSMWAGLRPLVRPADGDAAETRKVSREHTVLVAESGLRSPADLARMAKVGASAFLIGESFMRKPDVEAAVREILVREAA